MAIVNISTQDPLLNQYLTSITAGEYGRDIRSPLASAVERCYDLAVMRAGGVINGVFFTDIKEHSDRIRTAAFGEEVRDALKTGLILSFTARGINPSTEMNNLFVSLMDAQTGEDLKNNILLCVGRCGQEVYNA